MYKGQKMNNLTTAEAAIILEVSTRRIRALIESEKLKAERFGKSYSIKQKDLNKIKNRPPGRPKNKKGKNNGK